MTLPLVRSSRQQSSSRGGVSASKFISVLVQITFALFLCGSFYLAGAMLGHQSFDEAIMHAPMSVGRLIQGGSSSSAGDSAVDCKEAEKKLIESKVKEALAKHRKEMAKDTNINLSQKRLFPKTTNKFANGMVRVKKDELSELFDFGNPMDPGKGTGEEDALLLYQSKNGFPSSDKSLAQAIEYDDGNGIPLADPKTATENCDAMNVIFTGNPGNTKQCTAIIGNYESYHIQRWMKVDTVKSTPVKDDLPLQLVSRGYASRGKANFYAPPSDGKFSPVRRHWSMLQTFLENVDSVLDDLRPILKKVARNNAVVILTCNMGQSALLVNFACSARRRGFDLGNVLVFPTDVETQELAEGLGLATYYDEKNMGIMPSGEARRYGDKNFKAMMYAKVLCVLYPMLLGYDILFQDVDLVWIKDPMEFFNDKSNVKDFDIMFQHDGSNSVRYAPSSANSGFYWAKASKQSQYLFTSMLYHSDLIITWDSHQQVLVQLLSEHSSLFGLNVKVFDRETEMFPGGWHYHRKKDFMKKFIKREVDSYVFHMSWTDNKDNKLLFLRQLGEWYVKDKCVGKTATDILGGSSSLEKLALVEPCCAAEPIFSCHYQDKPSKLPCKGSPNIDKGTRSFW